MTMASEPPRVSIRLNDIAAEPFRLFFPAGVLAGVLGVALWPLHFLGALELYPGRYNSLRGAERARGRP